MEPCTGWRQNLEVCLKGVGGSRVKILLCDNLIGSEKLEYILPETFYRIEMLISILRYGVAKLAHKRSFRAIRVGNTPKKWIFKT